MRDVTFISYDLLAVIYRQFQRNRLEHSNVLTAAFVLNNIKPEAVPRGYVTE
jgi:hypothetical protein